MTTRQQWLIVGGIIVTAIGALLGAAELMKDELFPVTIGTHAPAFRVKVLGEQRHTTFADYEGQVVLLNVWATYCEPCKVEMPSLQKLHELYADKGLKILAVSIDDYVSEDSIRAYARNLGLTFEILHDSTHAIERVYQTTGYPETFVIGRDGMIRKKWIGADDWSSPGNRMLIAQLLGLETPVVVNDTAR
jgi:cytochrome c biogenesis protein CcmG, thiol:disulfide interchange protein DsbE